MTTLTPEQADALERVQNAIEYADRLKKASVGMLPDDLRILLDLARQQTRAAEAVDGEVETLNDIAEMMAEFVDNWPPVTTLHTALKLVAKTLRSAVDKRGWMPIEDQEPPREGNFLVWSPDHPEWAMPFRADIFWSARESRTPSHLSSGHFTMWRPMPLPAPPKQETPND